jgi:hypothetical protein
VFDGGLRAEAPPEFPPVRAGDAARAAWIVVANTVLNLDEALTRR